MRLRVMVVCAVALVPYAALAQVDSYDCLSTAHTNVGWSVSKKAYTAEAVTKISKPSIVKLSGMTSSQPSMTGQGVARLQRLSTDGTTTWYAEHAPAGTVIVWTFFAQQDGTDVAPTAVLMSSKSYDLFGGPVNFTDVYTCKPNSPLQRR